MTNITYYTRSNDGQIQDHFENIESALEYFLADDGYRLDIHMNKGNILFLYRDDFKQDTMFLYHDFLVAQSKIVYHKNNKTTTPSNIIKVNF
jgi:hypothetical protein